MRPESYKIQDGCWNCKNVFQWSEYDCGDMLHCTKHAEKRPICGSVWMGESFGDYLCKNGCDHDHPEHTERFHDMMEAWYKWSNENEVADSGKCDEWEPKQQ